MNVCLSKRDRDPTDVFQDNLWVSNYNLQHFGSTLPATIRSSSWDVLSCQGLYGDCNDPLEQLMCCEKPMNFNISQTPSP